ncbi:DNA-binding transcriptional regulator, LysR family [Paenibacillus algorifonticola]|uniref:DNA-binding transcriptional regulator, LysR family n=1 Tax=Paenibacillus algorifonticola TaxID=684063 RepID=A0A1I2BEH6_9BACL|nr:LysR family transcriptional regulator [Paenibacillus algorifonticola]SFE54602.1 DNA-binding transcriptional regulator, LysR family [Paenibacillus algorifonticola]
MRIEQLRYLVEVAHSSSITLAAEKLHLSQPNISNSIAALENEIGLAIFTRTRSGTRPTAVGNNLIQMAEDILSRWDNFTETAKLNSSLLNVRLVIGATFGACTSFLPKLLTHYSEKYPLVELEITESHPSEIEERLLSGDWDVGLIGTPEEMSFKNLVAEKFLTCKIMACVGGKSPLAYKESLSMEEIGKHSIISTSERMKEELQAYGTSREIFHSKHSEVSKRVISEGLGIGFYLDISLKNDPYVMTGHIVPIPLQVEHPVDFYWLHAKKKQSLACEAFIKELNVLIPQFMRMNA